MSLRYVYGFGGINMVSDQRESLILFTSDSYFEITVH